MTRHIALSFGRLQHFEDGLGEYAWQLGSHLARRAPDLAVARAWRFHFCLPARWHGMFGDGVSYHEVPARWRLGRRAPVAFALWHGLHQHLRHAPPANSRCNLLTLHDLNYAAVKSGLSLWRHARRHRRCLRQAHHLVVISRHVQAELERHFPAAPASDLIYNGVADLSRTPTTSVPELEGVPYLLHISRMSPNKNVKSLLALAAAWPAQRLVLVGPGSRHVRELQTICRERGLKNVLFLTNVSEGVKAWLYGNCRAFLFPSTREGFGLPPIEAMYFGKPVVVASRSALPEICGPAARYWHDFDPAAMRRVVCDLLAEVDAGDWCAGTVRAHALRYQWEPVVARYVELYARVLRQTFGTE
jgi:glycosyltransferase involved in cell wall biosynthesis